MFKFLKFWKDVSRLPRPLKLMICKECRVALHHKRFKLKYVMWQRSSMRLDYYTNTKGIPKLQLPTKVPHKEANHVCATKQMLEFGFMVPIQIMRRNVTNWSWKPNQIMDWMLDGRFVAKVGSFKPRPNLLCIEAQANGRNVSWCNKKAAHSFMSLKLTRKLGLLTCKAGKPTSVWFGND
jgi:hypothetical protein